MINRTKVGGCGKRFQETQPREVTFDDTPHTNPTVIVRICSVRVCSVCDHRLGPDGTDTGYRRATASWIRDGSGDARWTFRSRSDDAWSTRAIG